MITDKILTLHINIPSEREKICAVGRALSVPDRVRILNLLTARSMNLNEISKSPATFRMSSSEVFSSANVPKTFPKPRNCVVE